MTPIYTIFKSKQPRHISEFDRADKSGWLPGVMDTTICYKTQKAVFDRLNTEWSAMRNSRSDPRTPVKNALQIDENGIVSGGIIFKQNNEVYKRWVAQLILVD